MRQDYRPDLLLGNRLLVPTLIEATLVDLTGELFRLHAMTAVCKEENYGFFEFHTTSNRLSLLSIILFMFSGHYF